MQTIKTLIVDDEARIRRGIERLVLSCGEEWEVVATAGDGLEALDCFAAADGDIDLLITDVKMPEMDGLTLIKEAKKQYSFYPLLISGYDDFTYLQAAIREGAVDYLLKPVDREQFRQRMEEIGKIVDTGRYQKHKQGEMERDEKKLAHTKQTQTLSYIASMDIDASTLGYWVDDFPKGSYLLFDVRLDTLPVKSRSYRANDWKAYYYAMENIVAELLGEFATDGRGGWSWRGGESDFWLLLHLPVEGLEGGADWEEAADKLASDIRSAIRKFTPFTVSVAYGDAIEDLYLLPEAKRQAIALMNYRFLNGGNRTYRPSPELGSGSAAMDKDLSAIAQKLKRAVEQGSPEQAEEQTKAMFELLERATSPSYLQAAVQNALVLVHSAGLESVPGIADAAPIEDELSRVARATNLHELRMCVKQATDNVIGYIRKSRESGNAKPVEQAKSWIKEQLDQELTIKRIADHVYMNPTYFSEVFKLQTGETVLDYVTRQRMALAKELLGDPRLKLQEVSGKVGYQDVKYFGKLFKQWTGQTPSKYRERTHGGGESSNGNEQ
ncbi:response regulator [Cohnella endophytica]|uniref:Response regulator n=1 Tax=Cohnella endophytica TaxID=2419778 RepID=A0A494XQS2_9BACL|nr:helix-turn-helix domain-containing protein [Cohnella endophytica]RKP52990.1 response regulator [Cohnella endophytica]